MTNNAIVEALEERLKEDGRRKFLVTVKTGKIVHVNLTILSHLLGEMKKKGVYISIDRPHKYMELLMRRKHVPSEHICFVDVSTRSSADGGGRSLLSVGGFLWLKILAGTYDEIYGVNSEKIPKVDLRAMDFVLIDNASVLPAFNSLDSIREFFAELGNIVRDHKALRAFVVTPKDLHPRMLEVLRNFVDEVIDIPDEWVR